MRSSTISLDNCFMTIKAILFCSVSSAACPDTVEVVHTPEPRFSRRIAAAMRLLTLTWVFQDVSFPLSWFNVWRFGSSLASLEEATSKDANKGFYKKRRLSAPLCKVEVLELHKHQTTQSFVKRNTETTNCSIFHQPEVDCGFIQRRCSPSSDFAFRPKRSVKSVHSKVLNDTVGKN